jgi:D-sedoheptulose 7-phosphate isomerase
VTDTRNGIRRAFSESITAHEGFVEGQIEALNEVVHVVAQIFSRGNKVLLFGNGGSAADAQHIAAEFVNRFCRERPPLPAIALTTDTSVLTSISNDFSFDEVFAKQVKALGSRGDLGLAFSTSGNSPSVVAGVRACREKEMTTVGLTGPGGGRLKGEVDHLLSVEFGKTTARIQETHILIGHVICEMVDDLLFG